MKEFKIPRKLKKRLKKGIWFYHPDNNGNSRMAWPGKSSEDFEAFKNGKLRNMFDPFGSRIKQKKLSEKIDAEIVVSDEELKKYVDDIIREDLRRSSFETLLKAKNSKRAVSAYYNFINAYRLLVDKGEDSFGNICCLAIENAERLLKK
ncbi:hypothetical protein JM83_3699 [Gillisia sp. Hel_I_86]|uniref:hypothetical protein n=1 Tax=Gillisia sp. Hel_I_86 TaxID=1249981 RepID=UPI00119A1271|nr:hypothetical protein [Gillisia sp. Hel_I_86]TVZ28565.1 hypothetical protein JM83_3699 [Gillisia sp. Hel_I_86]